MQVDRNYAKMVAVIAIAASVVIFSLVVSNMLIKQIQYQNKVIGLRDKAATQLKKNVSAISPLVTAYQSFESAPESVIGTQQSNSKIVLDALPSKYDFPALATSLEYLAQQSGVTIKGISGVDNATTAEQSSVNPSPIEIPFDITVSGSYANTKKFVESLEKSIRPFSIQEVTLNGSDSDLTVTLKATTYYQPEKKLEIKETVVSQNGSAAKKTTTTKTGTTK